LLKGAIDKPLFYAPFFLSDLSRLDDCAAIDGVGIIIAMGVFPGRRINGVLSTNEQQCDG